MKASQGVSHTLADRADPDSHVSALAPFQHRVFTVLWLATVLSSIGTWMHDVGAGWLMTSLTTSPIWVALVQTATALPVFMLALPAGALADRFDRRRLLLGVQIMLALVAGSLGVTVWMGLMTPSLLLLFTFLMGMGAALTMPTWQSIVASLVPRAQLPQAVAINSVGINISRAIGPALAGVIIASAGLAMPFLINAISYLAVVGALLWWQSPAPAARTLPPEPLLGAMKSGLRYAWHSAPMKATLYRAIAFFVFASAYWAMLPLIARQLLGGDSRLYGMLLGSVGVGAVLGAVMLTRLRRRFGPDRIVVLGSVGTATTLVAFATLHHPLVAALACLLAGASWIIVLATLNVSAQLALPDWVRSRGLSIYVMSFFGAMSLGSVAWGQTAHHLGIPATLLLAALGMMLLVPLTRRCKLQQGATLNLAPSMHWPAPLVEGSVEHDRGPVMVTVEYHIDVTRAHDFVRAMDDVARQRQRDGASTWGLFEDTAQPGRYLEYFLVASWLEHLRQHERVTHADRDVQARANACLLPGQSPVVTHFLAPERA